MSGGKKKGGEQSPPVARRPPWETVEPSPEFLKEVAGWFRHPQGEPWPSTAMIRPLAQYLLFVGPRGLWTKNRIKQNENYNKQIKKRDKQVYSQEYDIIDSLTVLNETIPKQISKIRENIGKTTDECYIQSNENKIDALENLLHAICSIEPLYAFERNRKKERERAGLRRYWLKDGNWLYDIVIEIWRNAGRERPLSITHRSRIKATFRLTFVSF